jgi:predicted RNA binding protein YcfA (HicA-like mRNA interferase family)
VSTLPRISGREVAAALARIGYAFDRQSGSMILRNPKPPSRRMVVPDHREVAKGTLRGIIREPGLTVAEFVALLG